MNVNRVFLAGNLTKDPEIRYTPRGSAVCTFSIAVNRRFKAGDDQQAREETSFFDVECWGKTAEVSAQYLHKGRTALVEGRLKQERWQTQEGHNRSKVVVVAESVQFVGPPKDDHQGQSLEAGPQTAPEGQAAEDIPF